MKGYTPDENDITTVNGCKRQVVCAANKYDETIVLGVRHFCPLMRQSITALGLSPSQAHEQGFVDQWGNFMSREEALVVLQKNGRFIRDDKYDRRIYSENLY